MPGSGKTFRTASLYREEKVNKKIRTQNVDQLFEAVLKLENKEECYTFFEDICTPNELLSLSQRFDVGIRLLNGQTYQEICASNGASTATISRVNRLLSDDNEGIEMAAERIRKS